MLCPVFDLECVYFLLSQEFKQFNLFKKDIFKLAVLCIHPLQHVSLH